MTARELMVPGLRLQAPLTAGEQAQLQAIWEASQDQDELAGRPRGGWWSIHGWASSILLLHDGGQASGLVAVEYQRGAPAAEARLALLPGAQLEPDVTHARGDGGAGA